jgi:prepilin peptidase CpaA
LTALPSAWTYLILLLATALLLNAAWTDWREYRISNQLVLALAVLFIPYAFLADHWLNLTWDVGFAGLMSLVLLVFYAVGSMGGGDVKLLAVAFLWPGLSGALPFAILLALFSSAHGIAAKIGWVGSQITDAGRRRIPFAPSVAGALIGTFMLKTFALA